MVFFGSKSPEAEASLWNLMLYFDGSGVWYVHLHLYFRDSEIAV
jgi:hypothetical protein